MSLKRAALNLISPDAAARRRSRVMLAGLARGPLLPRGTLALTQHIGDLVAAEPASRYLAERTGRPTTWAVRGDLAKIVQCFPAVGRVVPLDSLTQWDAMRRTARGAIDFHVDGGWCERHAHKLRRPGCPVTRENYYAHGPLLVAFAKAAGLPPPESWAIDLTPRLDLPPEAHAAAEAADLPEKFAVFHCRSNQDTRDWTEDKWRQLAASLDVPVVEVGLKSVCGGVANVTDLCGRLDLLATAAVIGRASLFVGIDSGPAHFANAMGPPGVILLGKYGGFDRYLPYTGRYGGPGAIVIQHDQPVRELPVEAPLSACREMWSDCGP